MARQRPTEQPTTCPPALQPAIAAIAAATHPGQARERAEAGAGGRACGRWAARPAVAAPCAPPPAHAWCSAAHRAETPNGGSQRAAAPATSAIPPGMELGRRVAAGSRLHGWIASAHQPSPGPPVGLTPVSPHSVDSASRRLPLLPRPQQQPARRPRPRNRPSCPRASPETGPRQRAATRHSPAAGLSTVRLHSEMRMRCDRLGCSLSPLGPVIGSWQPPLQNTKERGSPTMAATSIDTGSLCRSPTAGRLQARSTAAPRGTLPQRGPRPLCTRLHGWRHAGPPMRPVAIGCARGIPLSPLRAGGGYSREKVLSAGISHRQTPRPSL
jgi:hypothetical protein